MLKTTIIGGVCGALAYFLILFPLMLHRLMDETALLLIWCKCGLMLIMFLYFVVVGILISQFIKEYFNYYYDYDYYDY